MTKKIAILTGGGHISSFHSGIQSILKSAHENGVGVIGFKDGYKGAKEGEYVLLNHSDIPNHLAGSCLGSTRDKADERVKKTIEKLGIEALIIMGGDDHLSEAAKLHEMGVPVIGWPKTMDNDLSATYFCLGYPTAVEVAANMLRCSHANAQTNSRIHLMTMFGRNTDWVVAGAGRWGLADIVVPCEQEYDFSYVFEKVQQAADKNRADYGRRFAVVAVAEGAKIKGLESHLSENEIDPFGHPKIEPMRLALVLKDAFKRMNDRCVSIDSISYLMRDSPSLDIDRMSASYAGHACFDMAMEGEFGMAATIGLSEDGLSLYIDKKPLAEAARKRYLKPEGFIDYDNLKVNSNFTEHYRPVFGEPVDRRNLIYPNK